MILCDRCMCEKSIPGIDKRIHDFFWCEIDLCKNCEEIVLKQRSICHDEILQYFKEWKKIKGKWKNGLYD